VCLSKIGLDQSTIIILKFIFNGKKILNKFTLQKISKKLISTKYWKLFQSKTISAVLLPSAQFYELSLKYWNEWTFSKLYNYTFIVRGFRHCFIPLPLTLTLPLSLFLSLPFFLSLSLSHAHTHSHIISFTLSHSLLHTHTHKHTLSLPLTFDSTVWL